jgi:hypothetical protein
MAFFTDDSSGDLHIDDNLFEFWGGLYDPHELDDAFAATAAAAAFLPITSVTPSASAGGIDPYSTNVPSSVSRIPSPAVIVSTVNIPNGIFLASDASSYISTARSSPLPEFEASTDHGEGIPSVSTISSRLTSSSSSSSSSTSLALPQSTAVSDDEVSSRDDDNSLVSTVLIPIFLLILLPVIPISSIDFGSDSNLLCCLFSIPLCNNATHLVLFRQ